MNQQIAPELREIPTWAGLYAVSEDGNVHSLPRPARIKDGRTRLHQGGLLQPRTDRHGYKIVTLCRNDRRETCLVHRLVALAWKPIGDTAGLDVNHIDGNPLNCRADNLEWCTRSENHRHAWRTGLRVHTDAMRANSVRMGLSNRLLTMEQAQNIRERAAAGVPKAHIARAFEVSPAAIHKIVNGQSYR